MTPATDTAATPAVRAKANVRGMPRSVEWRVRRVLDYLLMTVITVLFSAPIIYMFVGSFKPSDKVLNGLAGFVPESLSLSNYAGVIDRFNSEASGHVADFFLTSAIVSACIVIGGLVVNSMAGYAFARLRWRGRD